MRLPSLARLAAVLAGALALSGCGLASASFHFHSDNTVDGTVTIAVTEDAAKRHRLDLTALRKELQERAAAGDLGPKNTTVTDYRNGELRGATLTFTHAPLDRNKATALGGLTFSRIGEEIVVTGQLGPHSFPLDPALTAGLDQGADSDAIPITIAFRFPGPITAHEGVSVEGSTAIWRPPLGQDSRMTISAVAVAPPVPWGTILGLSAAGLVLLGGLIAIVLQRSRPIRATTGPSATAPDSAPACGPAITQDTTG